MGGLEGRFWAAAAMLAFALCGRADAALVGMPKAMGGMLKDVQLAAPFAGPKAHSPFCIDELEKCQAQKTALFGLPRQLRPQLDQVPHAAPMLAPMAHSLFCLKNPRDCEVRRIAFRGKPFEVTPDRWSELVKVNAQVNRSIRYERNVIGISAERWLIHPRGGDCNDYAVSKRHELLARGWPSRALLLAEVVTTWGEHHLVLVVRTAKGDFVLDNMNANIRPWSKTPYRWLRMGEEARPWSPAAPRAR